MGKIVPSEYLLFGDECHTLSRYLCLFVSAASVQKNLMFMYRKRSPRFILVLGPFLWGFLWGFWIFFGCGFTLKKIFIYKIVSKSTTEIYEICNRSNNIKFIIFLHKICFKICQRSKVQADYKNGWYFPLRVKKTR